jgi:hypothetical protein
MTSAFERPRHDENQDAGKQGERQVHFHEEFLTETTSARFAGFS